MAELLSREKELFKLNQELNLLATHQAQDNNQCPRLGAHKNTTYVYPESGYGTYSKQKGPSTLLKNKAAIAEAQRNAKESVKEHTSTRFSPKQRSTLPTAAVKKAAVPANTAGISHLLTKSKAPEWKPNVVQTTNTEPKFSTFTRGHVNKTATYVKYRNPNFTASTSLEEIINSEEAIKPEAEITKQRESTTVINGNAKKQLTQDNFIKFLKSKVAILEEDHARLSQEMVAQKERLDGTMDAQRRAETQRDLALNTNSQLTEQLRKAEEQCQNANRHQKESQLECSNHQREFEQIKRDARLLKQTNTNLENRLMRAQEDLESLRKSNATLRNEQREQLEAHRKELEQKEKRVKALKRQRADLLNAYKKQLYMIDNLKRQSTCMEQSMAVGFGEKEFNKVLNWNTKAS